jgi:predicted metalloendopeptidase
MLSPVTVQNQNRMKSPIFWHRYSQNYKLTPASQFSSSAYVRIKQKLTTLFCSLQVDSSERVVVNTPTYLGNLTEILRNESNRNIANYMLWRATRASIGFLNKQAREIIEEYARNITGKTATTPRWKTCVSSAAGSFSAAVGKMYVSKHFQEDAKDSMLEMVNDIRAEFKLLLNEVF